MSPSRCSYGQCLFAVTAALLVLTDLAPAIAQSGSTDDLNQMQAIAILPTIAILPFSESCTGNSRKWPEVTSAIAESLQSHARLRIVLPDIEECADAIPQFDQWRALRIQWLLKGHVNVMPDGRLRAEYRFWDISDDRQLVGHLLFFTSDELNDVAAFIAREIVERIASKHLVVPLRTPR